MTPRMSIFIDLLIYLLSYRFTSIQTQIYIFTFNQSEKKDNITGTSSQRKTVINSWCAEALKHPLL